jgi:hypothetical protein
MLGPIFSFFARNPIAQGIAGAFAVLFFMKANNWNQRRQGRNEGRQEAIDDINEQTEERIAEVKADLQLIDTIIDATPDYELRDEARSSRYNRASDRSDIL